MTTTPQNPVVRKLNLNVIVYAYQIQNWVFEMKDTAVSGPSSVLVLDEISESEIQYGREHHSRMHFSVPLIKY